MAIITDLSQLDLNNTYSYADYLTWQFEQRLELIKGKVMFMSPAPNVEHQRIERKLATKIDNYLQGKKCEVFYAPFDVRLYNRKKSVLASKDIYTVVQPDICVICNPDILDKQGCNGSPDWIIEIVSPSTRKRDTDIKLKLYAENGVQEYWLIFPNDCVINQFILTDQNSYQLKAIYADEGDIISSHLFPDLDIPLTDIFSQWQDY